jgi:ABC-type sugar transport system substrate-binding protein
VPGVQVPFVDLAEKDQAKEAGATAAKWVKQHFNASPKIVDLSVPNNTNCSNREDGFIAGATSADPATQVVARPNGQGVRLASQNAMADVIQSRKTFNIATGCNGESTLGALAALRAAGRGKAVNKVPVSEYLFSVDGTAAEVKELTDPSSPLMSTLALTPKDNTKALLDDLLNLIHKKISNTDNSVHLKDVFLPTDCAGVNKILQAQYGTTATCG